MSDGRIRAIGVPPSGPGLARALAQVAVEGSVVTSLDDARLATLKALVPAERELEFAPIGSLVSRFLTMIGEPVRVLCPRGQLQATIDIVCRDLPIDSPFAESSRFAGTAGLIRERLGELRDWCISPDELALATTNSSGTLQQKLDSLAEIDRKVRAILDETNRCFVSDQIERCLDIPPQMRVPIKRLVVDAGSVEKPIYERWLQWVSRLGTEVVVLVDEPIGDGRLFAASRRVCERLGVQSEPSTRETPWYAALFTYEKTDRSPSIEIVSAPDPLYESEWIVRGCLKLLTEGHLPHQIAVFARDSESYAPLLQSAADRLGLPMSAGLTVPLLSNGFACLILDILEALSGNDVRAIARIAHSSYIGASPTVHAAVTKASREAYASGHGQWEAIHKWADAQTEEYQWLVRLLRWRDSAAGSRGSLTTWWMRLRELVEGTKIIDLAADGSAFTKPRDTNAQQVLQRSIKDCCFIYDRTGRPELALGSFVELARSLWKEETVYVSGKTNGINLISTTQALAKYRCVFVAGMLEGTLPRRLAEDPILFDTERRAIADLLGRNVRLPSSVDRASAERDEFVRICASASDRIVFSFPETDDNRDNVPAFYLDEIQRACPTKNSKTLHTRSQIVPNQDACLSEVDRKIRTALDGPRSQRLSPELSSDAARATIRPDFEAGITPEHVSLAVTCEFHAVMRHALRLFPPMRRRLMRSLRDLPSVAGLATTKDQDEARKILRGAVDSYMQDAYTELEPWESSMLRAAGERLAEEWADREFRSREVWSVPEEETWVGVSLGERGLRHEVKIDGKTIRLRGEASSLTQRPTYTVMRFFDGSAPNLRDSSEYEDDKEAQFLYGLYLMSQVHIGPRNPAVEIDGMNGKRILAGFDGGAAKAKRDPKHGLEVQCVAESRDLFFQQIKERLRDAVHLIDAARMRAIPGRHCNGCPYGEVCRVSSEFGESFDTNEGGGL